MDGICLLMDGKGHLAAGGHWVPLHDADGLPGHGGHGAHCLMDEDQTGQLQGPQEQSTFGLMLDIKFK